MIKSLLGHDASRELIRCTILEYGEVLVLRLVRIGQFLLASATSGFSSYIELAYCSSAQELQ